MNPIAQPTAKAADGATPIRVLLADDHPVTLWGVRQLIESTFPRMVVSGTATTCSELMEHTALGQTDVVLLDLALRDGKTVDCVPRLVGERGLKVVVLTGDLNPSHHQAAVMHGARGVVLKSQPADDVLLAIERVHSGEVWLDGSLMSRLLGTMPGLAAAPAARKDEHAQRVATLTAKERMVIEAIVHYRGAKSLVIADALGMSEHTLRNHLTVIYSKLGVQGKLNLYAYALERGLTRQAGGATPFKRPSVWGALSLDWGSTPNA